MESSRIPPGLRWLLSKRGRRHPSGIRPCRLFVESLERRAMLDASVIFPITPDPPDPPYEELRPDLTTDNLDTRSLVYDGQTLSVSGTVMALATNRGRAASPPSDVLFFEDINGNDAYDASVDRPLGSTSIASLPAGGMTFVTATISGDVCFAGNTIWAVVDSGDSVAESDESNNLARPASRVAPQPGQFEPMVEWQKSEFSVRPDSNQVMMTPAVVDLNQDGTPEIVFSTFSADNYHTDGILRAVSGADGEDLWNVTDPDLEVAAKAGLAVGDIDLDGFPEIIAEHESGVLIAFEHDGTFKWKSPAIWVGINWGSPAIADLDADGTPEIVIGATVLNNDGTIRWQGNDAGGLGRGDNQTGPLSCVTDLDLDGSPEIVAGKTAYRSDGTVYWNATIRDGFPAVAEFDEDLYPEVVVVTAGEVYLLEHTGEVKWGPVPIPGGGAGGPPTVADTDGDGKPEIGVAGSDTFTLLESDGTIKWSRATQDHSSYKSGASAFDFESDGKAEIVYADELFLRIYRGDDGQTLYEFEKSTATTYEYPLVVDVDADGNAEIVAVANNYSTAIPGNQNGLYVLGDAADVWVPTRRIWNQHTYHVTNVNDDGTIPAREANSWEVHNTYRANALLDANPLDAPDLTASYLRTIGDEEEVTATARVGNGGALFVPAGIPVSFYDGDPAQGGKLLATTVTTVRLDPGRYEDVSVVVARENLGEIWVVADDRGTGSGQVRESDEANNAHHIRVSREEQLGAIDFLAVPSLDLAAGTLWYSLTTVRDGFLTLEASGTDSQIVLFDADCNRLAASRPAATGQRLDWMATAGQTFFARLSGSSQNVDLDIANLVGYDGANVAVYGTSDSDQFLFDADASCAMTVNGIAYEFTQGEAAAFSFDGLAGIDNVQFIGSSGADTATLWPTRGIFEAETYALAVTNVESIDYDGGEGDTVTIWGSKGTNLYTAEPGSGKMCGDGVSIHATAETIYARGNGGGDTVVFGDSAGDDVLEYFPVWARMRGQGYFHHVRGFKTMQADAELGEHGTDKVVFRGSRANDWLRVTPAAARFLSGTGSVWHVARGFDTIVAYGRGGSLIDKLFLRDTVGVDAFDLGRLEASVTTPDYTVLVHGFGTIRADRVNANESADKVTLSDSNWDDTLIGDPRQATISGPGFSNTVVGFPSVMAYSSGSGYDTAHFYDFTGSDDGRAEDDTFTANPLVAQLTGPGYKLWARLFDEVHAESRRGSDVANLIGNANVDQLNATATHVSLSGNHAEGSFVNSAVFFDDIHAFGGRNQDRAVLTGATIDTATLGPPEGVPWEDLSQRLWLNSLDDVDWEGGNIVAACRVFACWAANPADVLDASRDAAVSPGESVSAAMDETVPWDALSPIFRLGEFDGRHLLDVISGTKTEVDSVDQAFASW